MINIGMPIISGGIETVVDVATGVVSFISKLLPGLKGKTKHLDWGSADVKAKELANKFRNDVRSAYGDSVAGKIAKKYLQLMKTHIPATGLWVSGDNPEPTKNTMSLLNQLKEEEDINHIYNVTWIWGMWVMRNPDISSLNEMKNRITVDLNATLYKAVEIETGKKVTGDILPAGVSPGLVSLTPNNLTWIVGGAVVILIVFMFVKRK